MTGLSLGHQIGLRPVVVLYIKWDQYQDLYQSQTLNEIETETWSRNPKSPRLDQDDIVGQLSQIIEPIIRISLKFVLNYIY